MDANDAASYVQNLAGDDANIIFGAMYDDSTPDTCKITVIATGLDDASARVANVKDAEAEKIEKTEPTILGSSQNRRSGAAAKTAPSYSMPSFTIPKQTVAPTTSRPTAPKTPKKDIQIPDFLQKH